jgi:hypothetical protein
MSFEWVDWYTKLRDVIDTSALDHQALLNLQGGSATERYHLTVAQLALVTGAEQLVNKNAANGYAGLNVVSRTTKGVDTTDDVIVDDNLNGLVLKDNAGTPHYWRVTVDSAGVITTTDLGTTKP